MNPLKAFTPTALLGGGTAAALVIAIGVGGSVRAAGGYPLALTLDATAGNDVTAVRSIVSLDVNRLMEESRRKRVTDALTYSGYGNFLTALRGLPPIGTITVNTRSVEIRYARERQEEAGGRRLQLIADRPLFFIGADPAKSRAGYELTVVDLHFDQQGGVTGTMAGAARVKPSPDGPVLDDFAESPVRLSAPAARR